jgi:hypothetical protein
MTIKEKNKIRFYCPRDNAGFVTDRKTNILCRAGDHIILPEFPPNKDYWAFCSGCERFFPLSVFDEKEEHCRFCISCSRTINDCYLCSGCNTVFLESGNADQTGKYLSKSDEKPVLICPACETVNPQTTDFILHDCETMRRSFWLTREDCPFCGLPADPLKRSIMFRVSDLNDVPEPAVVSETALNEPNNQSTTVVEERTDFILPHRDLPTNIVDNAFEIQPSPARDSNKYGCLIFLLVVSMCFGSIYLINFIRNSDSSGASDDSVVLISPTPDKPPNISPTPIAAKTTPVSPKEKTFRNNSKVTSDNVSLKTEPEDFADDIELLPLGTLIRVKDRKSINSVWYKVKTEDGNEGWINGSFIAPPDWNSVPCKTGDTGFISGGNLRTSPNHSGNAENILAVWDRGSKVKILEKTIGEPGTRTNNKVWYKIKVLSGDCSFDSRNAYTKTYSCDLEDEGFMHSNLIDCD